MDTQYYPRSSYPPGIPSRSIESPTVSHIKGEQAPLEPGATKAPRQRYHYTNRQQGCSIPFPYFHDSEEKRRTEIDYQSQKTEQSSEEATIQDGRNPLTARSANERRLDGESGPQGGILSNPHPQTVSEFAGVPLELETVPVHMPSVWPLMCTKSIHQGSEACGSLSQGKRDPVNNLYRQHSHHGSIERVGTNTFVGNPRPLGDARIPDKLSKVHSIPNSSDRAPGIRSELQRDETLSPSGTDDGFCNGGNNNIELPSSGISPPISKNDWTTQCHHPCNSTSTPPLLQLTANKEQTGLMWGLQEQGSSDRRGTTRAEVVDTIPVSSEWKSHQAQSSRHDFIHRCVTVGMGSNIRRGEDRWCLEQ